MSSLPASAASLVDTGTALQAPHVTALVAALGAALYLVLSARVILRRRGRRVSLGDGGDPVLLRRVRVHANCAEYLPLGLVLLGLAETLGTPAAAVAVLGAGLLAGRVLHALGVDRVPQSLALRTAGMVLTLAAIGIAAVLLAVLALA